MSKLPFSFRADAGLTLLELAVTMALLGLGVARVIPAARHQLDHMAVVAAREEAAGIFHRAREEAVARGGVEVVVTADPPRAELLSGADTLLRSNLHEAYGVSLGLSGGRLEARLTFGPLGLGWVASQTLRFNRGRAESSLVISSLGRVARR